MSNNRPNPEVKERVWKFLLALMQYIEPDEEQLHNQCPTKIYRQVLGRGQKLDVTTTTKHLMLLTGLKTTEISDSINRLKDLGKWLKPFGPKQGVKIRRFTLTLPSNEIQEVRREFEQRWQQFEQEKAQFRQEKARLDSENGWHLAFHDRLKREQRWLSVSRLLIRDGIRKPFDDTNFVAPFFNRFQSEDTIRNATESYRKTQDLEQRNLISYEIFLNEVVHRSKSEQPSHIRIAVTGKAGSGKTMVLQQAAFYLSRELKYLPILISLAQWKQFDNDLSSLESFIRIDWLNSLIPGVEIISNTQVFFQRLCLQGKVCLLIDAIDEVNDVELNETVQLQEQLKQSPLLAKVMVVVTCRIEHWRSARNALQTDFDTYELLDLDNDDEPTPNSVAKFVLSWFHQNERLGQELIEELNKQENFELKRLVKNRLYLALLCHRWAKYSNQGGLPNSSMSIYRRFVEDLFDWRPGLNISSTLHKQLEQALTELAYRALRDEVNPFRISNQLVEKLWEEKGYSYNWLDLLEDVGILYREITVNSFDEVTYTFLHAVFQEYFAVKFISNNWNLLFNLNSKRVQDYFVYYVQELRWRRVYLLLLSWKSFPSEHKEALLEVLTHFEDDCGGFYKHHAYLMAVIGLKEFPKSRQAEEIVFQVVKWSFRPNQFSTVLDDYSTSISEASIKALQGTNAQCAIAVLEKQLKSAQSDEIQAQCAELLGLFEDSKLFAIDLLTNLMDSQNVNVNVKCYVAICLRYLDPEDLNWVPSVGTLLKSQDETLLVQAAAILSRFPSNYWDSAVQKLLELELNSTNLSVKYAARLALMPLKKLLAIELGLKDLALEHSSSTFVTSNISDLLKPVTHSLQQPLQSIEANFVLAETILTTDNLTELLSSRCTMVKVIQALKKGLLMSKFTYNFESNPPYEALQRCVEVVPYLVFHEAWHTEDNS